MPQNRIISLIASATEIVCALGLREQLVGRSHECDWPPDVKQLPQCTEPKFPTDGTSYEIDQRVRQVLQESLSVYRVHAEMLDSLQPTHIVTQSQCEVCAVSLKDVEAAACEMIRSQPKIISLHPNVLDDVWNDINAVAGAVGVPDRGRQLVEELKGRIEDVRARKPKVGEKKKVAFIEWIDPLMYGGNWMPELMEAAGVLPATLEEKPDVIIVAPCGFDIDRTLQEKPEFDGEVYIADGNQYFNRPGPRLVESLEIIAEIAYPERHPVKHRQTGWIRYDRK